MITKFKITGQVLIQILAENKYKNLYTDPTDAYTTDYQKKTIRNQ